jgi:hypothetical protein
VKWWRRNGSSHSEWLEPFSDRVPGLNGFSFEVDYHIEIFTADVGALSMQYDPCVAAVRAMVEPVLACCDVLRPAVAQQNVNLRLFRPSSNREPGAVVRQSQVFIRVDRDTVESARRHAKALMDAKAQEAARDAIRAQMRFLETEVLCSPAALQVYLLATEITQNKQVTARSLDELESLAESVYKWLPDNQWVETAKIMHAHLGSLPSHEVAALLSTLRDSIHDHENPALLARFDKVHNGQQVGTIGAKG